MNCSCGRKIRKNRYLERSRNGLCGQCYLRQEYKSPWKEQGLDARLIVEALYK